MCTLLSKNLVRQADRDLRLLFLHAIEFYCPPASYLPFEISQKQLPEYISKCDSMRQSTYLNNSKITIFTKRGQKYLIKGKLPFISNFRSSSHHCYSFPVMGWDRSQSGKFILTYLHWFWYCIMCTYLMSCIEFKVMLNFSHLFNMPIRDVLKEILLFGRVWKTFWKIWDLTTPLRALWLPFPRQIFIRNKDAEVGCPPETL